MAQTILGNITATDFLMNYWQKKPLLIRHALPDFISPLTPDELAGLSLEQEVESRIVSGRGNQWHLQQGPFSEDSFTKTGSKDWTLLVQGVDQWVPDVRDLIDYFSFIPRWRIDDIMVSYAATGGSVGAHFDYYDVFLIQGAGKRRWDIGARCDNSPPFLKDIPLKIMAEFKATDSWVLEPGDILYLPPCIAHHGTSLDDDCMTYSVGFRSPTATEMLNDLALQLLGGAEPEQHLQDPPLTPDIGDNLPESYLPQIRALLLSCLSNDDLLRDWFASYMTRQKQFDTETQDLQGISAGELLRAIDNNSIRELLPNARVLKTIKGIYLDGKKLD